MEADGVSGPPAHTTTKRITARRRKYHRCEECGLVLTFDDVCPRHPAAIRIHWPQARDAAAKYLQTQDIQGMAGKELDEWVERYDPNYFPGTTTGDLALVLTYLRKWGKLRETGLPDIRPITIFGPRA